MRFNPEPKLPFVASKTGEGIEIEIIKDGKFSAWLKSQTKSLTNQIVQEGFGTGTDQKKTFLHFNAKGELNSVYLIVKKKVELYDLSGVAAKLKSTLSDTYIKKARFKLKIADLTKNEVQNALIGWGINAYEFDDYKSKKSSPSPTIIWPDKADKKRVEAYIKSMFIIRDLINLPANDLGPVELEKAVKSVGKDLKARTSVIADKKLQEQNFPLIYTVGQAGGKDRRPRLVELKWGNRKDPKLTLVGKGVVFDTGGLNLKPGQYMALMKKDMGGAAHALALSYLIMSLKLPVYLHLIIPAVENAVGGESFRPGDIIKSRKGHFVENTNTDAEGRLILADALAYACEGKPDLLIDFATLTGSARAALGQDIPAFFTINEKTGQAIQQRSFEINDPLWRMPLYEPYNKHIENATGDLVNSASPPGDLIYSALFLKKFVEEKTDWVHLDLFAWESNGKPGRTKGGTDMGLRTLFDYLESRYG